MAILSSNLHLFYVSLDFLLHKLVVDIVSEKKKVKGCVTWIKTIISDFGAIIITTIKQNKKKDENMMHKREKHEF